MNYHNMNYHPMPQQPTTMTAPPPPLQMMYDDRRRRQDGGGGVLGGNGYVYRNQNFYNSNRFNNNNRFENGNSTNDNRGNRYNQHSGYRNVSPMRYDSYPSRQPMNSHNQGSNEPWQPRRSYDKPQRFMNDRPRSPSIQRQRLERRQPSENGRQQQRARGPRAIRLNDFMPPQLRDLSPNTVDLPSEFTIATSAAVTTGEVPADALPQRQRFVNTTQPFDTNSRNSDRPNDPPREATRPPTTTASYRRRQRRIGQQQQSHRQTNRFAPLMNSDEQVPEAAAELDNTDEPQSIQKTKQKTRLYLQQNRMFAWFQVNAANVISGRGNQAYVLATAHIYDRWVRNNYELQVWQAYLKIGTEDKHGAKEVVQRTKKRDSVINDRFVKKKINRLIAEIAQASAAISDLQVQLGTYWVHTTGAAMPPATVATTDPTTLTVTDANRTRDPVNRIERSILKYIHYCTQHVKKMAETKVQLARAQMEEFKSLEDFEQIATPLQWNIHLTLKPKMKTWSTKHKNYQTALRRVEYDLPPKLIEKIDFSFKLDESIIGQEEAQPLYDQMRQITKEFRLRAMTLYVQAVTREHELLDAEIKQIIEGFPKVNADDGMDDEAGFAAFKQYHELREKRFHLETEQAIYFLDEQRVEGEPNDQAEEIIAPTLTRSLGEDFLLQL
jgi:hypothetical protein